MRRDGLLTRPRPGTPTCRRPLDWSFASSVRGCGEGLVPMSSLAWRVATGEELRKVRRYRRGVRRPVAPPERHDGADGRPDSIPPPSHAGGGRGSRDRPVPAKFSSEPRVSPSARRRPENGASTLVRVLLLTLSSNFRTVTKDAVLQSARGPEPTWRGALARLIPGRLPKPAPVAAPVQWAHHRSAIETGAQRVARVVIFAPGSPGGLEVAGRISPPRRVRRRFRINRRRRTRNRATLRRYMPPRRRARLGSPAAPRRSSLFLRRRASCPSSGPPGRCRR